VRIVIVATLALSQVIGILALAHILVILA